MFRLAIQMYHKHVFVSFTMPFGKPGINAINPRGVYIFSTVSFRMLYGSTKVFAAKSNFFKKNLFKTNSLSKCKQIIQHCITGWIINI